MSKVSRKSYDIINNFDDRNLEFISKPFNKGDNTRPNQEYTMVQKNAPCKVRPSVSGMKKSIKLLLK